MGRIPLNNTTVTITDTVARGALAIVPNRVSRQAVPVGQADGARGGGAVVAGETLALAGRAGKGPVGWLDVRTTLACQTDSTAWRSGRGKGDASSPAACDFAGPVGGGRGIVASDFEEEVLLGKGERDRRSSHNERPENRISRPAPMDGWGWMKKNK